MMPTIAIIDGVRVVIYPKDHLPPHIHAIYGEFEAQYSIETGRLLNGKLPPAKKRAIESWLDASRDRVSAAWVDIVANRFDGRRID